MIINYCSILIRKGVYKDQIETFDVGEIEKLELRVNPPAPKPYISTTPEPKFTLKENIMYGIREPVNDHHNEPEGIINDKDQIQEA